MQSFWWFIDGRAGGMGRPGFGRCHWFDLSFEEGVLLSWLGKQQHTTCPLISLWSYLDHYGPRVAPFYGLSIAEVHNRLHGLRGRSSLLAALEQMNKKARVLDDILWVESYQEAALRFTPSVRAVYDDIAFLQGQRVSVLISLLEQPFDQAILQEAFELYHVPVEDVTPPAHEQVYAFASILRKALQDGKNVVTHCLAGVGRTTTMLMAAYLVQGYPLPDLVNRVRRCNPHFAFIGRQATFLQELAEDVRGGHLPTLSTIRQPVICR